jgi:hypothetical protein
MNYFKGSGSCGVSTLPKYLTKKENFKKVFMNTSTIIHKDEVNNKRQIMTKT